MKKLLFTSISTLLLATGCGSLNTPKHPSGLPLGNHNAQYSLTFFLTASWQGYSVLIQQWNEYVFGMSSRYAFDDSVRGWKETAGIVERNRAANNMPHLYPE